MTAKDKIDKILLDYQGCFSGSNQLDEAHSRVVGQHNLKLHNKAKDQLFALLMDVIGDELGEEDGWDWAFSDEAKCCPGDDFAYYGNHIKKLQTAKLNKLFNKEEK